MHHCNFHYFLGLTSSEILQEVLFLVVFLLPPPAEWKHYTMACENERDLRHQWAGSWEHWISAFYGCSWLGSRGVRDEGRYGGACQPSAARNAWCPLGKVAGEWKCGLWAGTGLGRRALASLLSPPYLTPAEKLINLRCRFAALGQFLLYLNESAQHPHTA